MTWRIPIHTIIGVGAAMLFAGCDSNPAIFRYLQLSTGSEVSDGKGGSKITPGTDEAIVTDAKQRVITRTTFHGENSLNSNRIQPKVITCAEPSPDVAQAISDSISASLGAVIGGGKSVDASFARATAESIAQLGERIATIQLLRDELSDLCRSYANGAVTATTYTLRLSKLDKKMVTLLIGEMTAGAFGRTLAQISASAGADTGQVDEAKLKEAQDNVKKAQGEVDSHRASLDAIKPEEDADGKKRADAQKALTEATKTLHSAMQVELAVRRGQLAVNAGGGAGFGIGAIARQFQSGDGTTASQMAVIQRQFLEQDDVSTLIDACLTSMDILRGRSEQQGTLLPTGYLSDAQTKTEKQRDYVQRLRNDLSKYRSEMADVEAKQSIIKKTGKSVDGIALLPAQRESVLARLDAEWSKIFGDRNEAASLLEKAENELAGLVKRESDLQEAIIRQSAATPLSPLGDYCKNKLPDLVQAATERHTSVTDIRRQELKNAEADKQAALEKARSERLKAEEATNVSAVAVAATQSSLAEQRTRAEALVSCRAYMQSAKPEGFPPAVREFCDKTLKAIAP